MWLKHAAAGRFTTAGTQRVGVFFAGALPYREPSHKRHETLPRREEIVLTFQNPFFFVSMVSSILKRFLVTDPQLKAGRPESLSKTDTQTKILARWHKLVFEKNDLLKITLAGSSRSNVQESITLFILLAFPFFLQAETPTC